MLKTIGLLTGGLVVGFLITQVIALLGDNQENGPAFLSPQQTLADNSQQNFAVQSPEALNQRLLALETQLAEEIKQRQGLENLLGEMLEGRWLGDGSEADTGESTAGAESNRGPARLAEERQQQFRERAQQQQRNQNCR